MSKDSDNKYTNPKFSKDIQIPKPANILEKSNQPKPHNIGSSTQPKPAAPLTTGQGDDPPPRKPPPAHNK